MGDPIRVASVSDIEPGSAISIEVNGRTIAVFNCKGTFYALDNVCAHRGGPLCEGFIDDKNLTVQCPWHGWTYNLETGISPINPSAKVETFDVQVEDDAVKLTIE